jgi:REP element-mobilizing transposase RayT
VLEHCLHEDGHKVWVHGGVVMPDHVHVIMTPLRDAQGRAYGLTEIMNSIKGASAHTVNRELGRRGHVWQAESFDRVLRSRDDLREKVEYICANPVRKGLATDVDSYPWRWREYVEGVWRSRPRLRASPQARAPELPPIPAGRLSYSPAARGRAGGGPC